MSMRGLLSAVVLVVILKLSVNHVDARSGGAPVQACRDMTPGHGPSNGGIVGPYSVTTNIGPTYSLSTTYTGNGTLISWW